MGTARLRGRRTPSLRIRLLAIALIPGLVALGVGVVVSLNLIDDAKQNEDLAQAVGPAAAGAVAFVPLIQAERRASLTFSSTPSPENQARLAQARAGVDGLAAQLAQSATEVLEALPGKLQAPIAEFTATLGQLPQMRGQIDNAQVGRLEIYRFFNRATDVIGNGTEIIARDAIDAEVATERTTAAALIRAGDWLDRGNALAASALAAQGMTRTEFDEFVRMTGSHRAELEQVLPRLRPAEQARIEELRGSPEWQRATTTADDLIGRGFSALSNVAVPTRGASLPDLAGWEQSATAVADTIGTLGLERSGGAAGIEDRKAGDDVRNATLAAVLMLVGIVIVFAVALLVTGRLVRRLARLRAETLAIAQRTLPDTVEKLRAGVDVDVATEIPRLDHGRDEIGQVASAFNQAQQTAVRAAVDEARTRAGINAVFLNIARRSQNIVHRQLQVLDEVERAETDPDQLSLLFQLDHLATRERRNAENLIILGGQQPGRQWRNPVLLNELVRSAVGETEDYQRVSPGRLPRVWVAGKAVGDLVHLLAELVDNATGFSPPDSPIEVSGTTVGRGVVVEVEDQGLGINPELRDELNELLRHPPDFGLMTLSEDSRLGLFVVARLANRHGMIVTLRESAYGGVKAGVLIPTALLDIGDHGDPVAPASSLEIIEARPQAPNGSNGSLVNGAIPESPDRAPRRLPLHRAQVQEPRSSPPAPVADLPDLPRRRRLSHMDSRLRDQVFEDAAPPSELVDMPRQPGPAHSPDAARHRMSALQRGTRRGRTEGSLAGPSIHTEGSLEGPSIHSEGDSGARRDPAHAGDEGA